jgi:kinesin family protein 18/19
LDKKLVILIDPYEYNGHSEIFKNRSREQQYAFDDGVVNGYNATVFAYGATGAGKTYT